MQRNFINNTAPSTEGVVNLELGKTMTSFLDTHNSQDADENLNMLLQSWLCPDLEIKRSRIEIANMAFFVNGLITFTRKINNYSNDSLTIEEFYDIFSQVGIEEKLNEMLSVWICPLHSDPEPIESSNMVDFVYYIIRFLTELEGGLLCAY